MKLTYWVSEIETDNDVYNVRAKTKKECLRLRELRDNCNSYGPVHKVTIEYKDAFELLSTAMSDEKYYEGENQ